MAQESKDKEREVDEDKAPDASDEPAVHGSSEMMRAGDDEALVKVPGDDVEGEEGEALEGEEGDAAAQLGSDRYVLAGFFAAGMLGAYVLGRAIQSAWTAVAPKDWFAQSVPFLAAVPDEDKQTYGILLGGIIALVVVYRTYKKPEVRAWSDEVAAELAKVVWPSRKDVTSSTFIVIVSSAAATIYLALLDRLWAFITNIVYGDGS
jgi:preprotein translocase subunit SecE